MKISGAKKVHLETGPNMTPLVDVVMVILIFLMLAGSFGGTEQYLASNLPVKASGPGDADKNKKTLPDEPMEIRVDASMMPSYDANGKEMDNFQVRVPGFSPVADPSRDWLVSTLTKKRQAFTAAGTPLDKVQVIISPGKYAKYRSLIKVYEAALEAEFTKIAFSTAH